MPSVAAIPGPRPSPFRRLIYRPGPDPLGFFTNLARTYGDIVGFEMGGEQVVMVNAPHHVRDILVTNNRLFMKGRGLQRSKRLLGEGLLTSEDPLHLRQRRLMQPAFHRERIAAYGDTMVAYADRLRQQWRDGQTLDVAQEMMRVTLSIAGKTLFGVDVESQASDVGKALTEVMESFWLTMLPFAELLERLPVPQLRRSRAARARLDAIIYRMIAERRNSRQSPVASRQSAVASHRSDLLSLLLAARDEDDGGAMNDQQVRDEAMTIFLAGHETTANALTWTWYLVSTAPAVEAHLHEEVDRVLQGRLPRVSDIAALPFVERVVTEAMRLYPPAWLIGRRALREYRIGGPSTGSGPARAESTGDYVVPPRTIIVTSPYVMQRDPRFFPDPEQFEPDRWTPEFRAALPPFAYFPFGGGPRRCIGESFAWMELALVVATIAQQWTLELVPGHPVEPLPVVTLRTKHGMRMTLHHRNVKSGIGNEECGIRTEE